MIVTDRDFNDADVRRALDTKFDDDSTGGHTTMRSSHVFRHQK